MAIGLVLATALAATSLGLQTQAPPDKGQDRAQRGGPAAREGLRNALALSDAFKEVYRSVAPSVVNIRSTINPQETNTSQFNQPSPLDEELFRRFFGQDLPQLQPRPRVGEGTGVIARDDGYIITNNHVVDGADEIIVKLDDEREYDGTVVGTDPETDLAVVKIDATGLTAAKFGDSEALDIGEWVLALGSPFGLQHTVTAGIVSAKGRGTLGIADIGDFIQTDAAINPGNSGGPLVNLYGEVVGINSAISTRTGTYAGVGFAIPSNIATPVTNTIISGGKVERGWLGVQIGPISREAADYAGYQGTQGALVSMVVPASPAETAGLVDGDIITHINGRKVSDASELLNTVASTPPGEKVNLKVYRGGQTKDTSVTLGDRSQQQLTRRSNGRQRDGDRAPGSSTLGLTVQDLTPEIARRLGASTREGVVVTQVSAGSPAAREGIEAGDIITMVNETKVSTAQEFSSAVREADPNKSIRLQMIRDDATQFVYVKPEESGGRSRRPSKPD
ncbi:MAG: DegQ family serine endoprotease [Phycisphaerales bacterium]|nr:DegQ family serine endoprotease [Phycisphaerales bacterium]MCI0629623.1 DegQ family serine endoprotease [Phycisphaerales bacterium]MCI0675906.1 DegQ family serine endoprotease [Phycisphaerales bacterium]